MHVDTRWNPSIETLPCRLLCLDDSMPASTHKSTFTNAYHVEVHPVAEHAVAQMVVRHAQEGVVKKHVGNPLSHKLVHQVFVNTSELSTWYTHDEVRLFLCCKRSELIANNK